MAVVTRAAHTTVVTRTVRTARVDIPSATMVTEAIRPTGPTTVTRVVLPTMITAVAMLSRVAVRPRPTGTARTIVVTRVAMPTGRARAAVFTGVAVATGVAMLPWVAVLTSATVVTRMAVVARVACTAVVARTVGPAGVEMSRTAVVTGAVGPAVVAGVARPAVITEVAGSPVASMVAAGLPWTVVLTVPAEAALRRVPPRPVAGVVTEARTVTEVHMAGTPLVGIRLFAEADLRAEAGATESELLAVAERTHPGEAVVAAEVSGIVRPFGDGLLEVADGDIPGEGVPVFTSPIGDLGDGLGDALHVHGAADSGVDAPLAVLTHLHGGVWGRHLCVAGHRDAAVRRFAGEQGLR
jgi:hypothetical protein